MDCTGICTQFSVVCADWLSVTILLYRPIENIESVSIEIDGLERTASFLEFPGEVRCCVTMAIVLCDYCMEQCCVRVSCTSTREGILLSVRIGQR